MQTKQMGIKGVARELGWVPWGWGSGHEGAAPDLSLERLRARKGWRCSRAKWESNGRCALPRRWAAGAVTGMGISEGLGDRRGKVTSPKGTRSGGQPAAQLSASIGNHRRLFPSIEAQYLRRQFRMLLWQVQCQRHTVQDSVLDSSNHPWPLALGRGRGWSKGAERPPISGRPPILPIPDTHLLSTAGF